MRYYILSGLLLITTIIAFSSCNENPSGLPVIGFKLPVEKVVNGEKVIDTVEHTIPDFSFVNQDSNIVTHKMVEGKIYLADFFFTSCPTICPKVKKNMRKIYAQYKDKDDFLILSHSIDTKYDTVGRLAWYADKFNISSDSWHLLTGDKEEIYKIARQYYIAAVETPEDLESGGFDHSGAIALVDRQRRIRGLYDGTDPERMAQLAIDLQLLMDKE